ncbi:MAG: hypothetical protein CM1200mP4_5040 [Rhodospirillaceae bacterium]|nr:MAG: hypothetical protein CM1200mP4_5040 [Rhodospirillaceae bacterium]
MFFSELDRWRHYTRSHGNGFGRRYSWCACRAGISQRKWRGFPGSRLLERLEAATLPCAALTAWHALKRGKKPVNAGETYFCWEQAGSRYLPNNFARLWAQLRSLFLLRTKSGAELGPSEPDRQLTIMRPQIGPRLCLNDRWPRGG